ncbi:hypothetical protein X798_05267, partial [Onchocerca flexuosa]
FQIIEQCPCVKPPGSNQCLSYDNRLQAANIEEALHTFLDLSSMTEIALPLVMEEESVMMKTTIQFSFQQKMTYKTPTTYKCDRKECKACKLLITNAFRRANHNDFSTIISATTGMSADTDESLCIKNRFISRIINVGDGIKNATNVKELSPHLEEFINLLKQKIRKRRNLKKSKQKCMKLD